MADPKGFMKVARKDGGNRPISERIDDYGEVEQTLNEQDRRLQASRCMDCGIPFCHWACPVGSKIPEWQDAAWKGDWKLASEILQSTNSFPEFTGRICPHPCEKSCTLAIHHDAVTIRENEAGIMERAFDMGYVQPRIPQHRTGKRIAVIGSGPAGLSAADLLNQAGHHVVVFEKDDAVGGLLRYGIPDFKLSKKVIDRRIKIFEAEGVEFRCNVHVGSDITGEALLADFDAVVLAIGAMKPRDIQVEGRELEGIHFAMDFLKQQNKVVRGEEIDAKVRLSARGKNVLVIGGGDTGSDCVGTSNRQKAASVMQIEIMPKPPVVRASNNPWPFWPMVLKTSSSHEEGCDRRWSLNTKRFIGVNGSVKQVELVEVEWKRNDAGQMAMVEIPGSEFVVEAQLVLLSMGFVSPVHEGLVTELGLELDGRGNIKVSPDFATSRSGVFATGDAANGASLVVTAIARGRETARKVHEFVTQ